MIPATYIREWRNQVPWQETDMIEQIILCMDKNNIAAEYALGGLNNQLFESRYTLYIHNKDILIEQVRKTIGE